MSRVENMNIYSIIKNWKRLLPGRVPDNNYLLSGTPLKCPLVLAGHASGCWLSALGAGVPYNREKKRK